MKRYYGYDIDGGFPLIVGNDRQIRSLYRALEKHGFMPTFSNPPKFRYGGMYGLILEADGWYHVISADTTLALLVDNLLVDSIAA